MKTCNSCKISQNINNFNNNKNHIDGFDPRCKTCHKKYRDSIKNKQKTYDKEYKLKNKLKNKLYDDNYYILNKDKRKKHIEEYRQNNKEKINARNKKRLILDPKFKLIKNFRIRINYFLKQNKINKNNSYINYLGCSIEEFKHHLEQQFKPEMTWENHGIIWEIDHIIPCDIFNLTKEENIFKAFNYLNTQPLFKTTKIAKSFGYKNEIGNRDKSNKIIK
jgi:hypothetical protein